MAIPSTTKTWRVRADADSISEARQTLVRKLRLSPLIASLLTRRGLHDPDTAHSFLYPTLQGLASPHLIDNMDKALDLILVAMGEGRPFLLYGDYDVDGITSLAVLTLFFRSLGMKHVYSLQPNRIHDGYGFHFSVVRDFLEKNENVAYKKPLVITVDCGISDVETVKALTARGVSVIITDHHLPPPTLPPAEAILNPKLGSHDSPLRDLAGVGVAFYLVMALRSRLQGIGHWSHGHAPNLKQYLDLVAIGTICDLAPLIGVNRVMARAGLEILSCPPVRPGLQSLLRICNLSDAPAISEEDVGFRLGPRINAPSRIGADPALALRLLLTEQAREADQLAHVLDGMNKERKALSDAVFTEAIERAENLVAAGRNSIVLASPSWHHGVLGIAASKVQETFSRPVFLLCCQDGEARGSGRSITGFNLYEALDLIRECLDGYGGHAGAAGVRISEGFLDIFSERFEEIVVKKMAGREKEDNLLKIDAVLTGEEFRDQKFFQEYARLQPFGIGNKEPVFAMHAVRLSNSRIVGQEHLRFQWRGSGIAMSGIGFGLGNMIHVVDAVNPTDFAFILKQNHYNGNSSWELRALDVRESIVV